MPVRFRHIVSLLLVVCGVVLMVRPAAAVSSSPAVLINEFMPNTGADSNTPEWVELFNPGPFAIDVSGWKIVDDTISHPQTTIGAGTVLPPNSLLVVVLATNIFNNTGTDAAQLLDVGGTIIDMHSYNGTTAGQSYARTPDGSAIWSKGAPSQGTWNVAPGPTTAPTDPPTDTVTPTDTPANMGAHVEMDTAAPVSPASTSMPTATDTATSVPPTNTPTQTPTRTPSPTNTATNTRTPSPTRTASPTNTATNTATDTAIPTSTAAATATAVPVSPTDTPTATPYPTGILLNEFLANPKTLYSDEWIELYNTGSNTIDLSGWKLDDIDGGSAPYMLPNGTVLASGAFLAINLPSAMLNNDGDSVRLLGPDGSLVDATSYTGSVADQSQSRGSQGDWYLSSANTPGMPNAEPAEPTATNAPSPTHTPSATTMPSATRTPSPTRTATAVRMPTLTRTPSPTRTATAVRMPTSTRTLSPTRIPSPTRTATAVRKPTSTRTPSPTRTPKATRTPSPTPKPAQSAPHPTASVSTTDPEALNLHQHSLGSASSPLPHAWLQASSAAAPAYANTMVSVPYRGAASATPIPTFGTPTQAPRATQPTDARLPAPSAGLSLSMWAGMFLFATGSVISGYDWLRGHRAPAPAHLNEDELLGVLDDELTGDDPPEEDHKS